MKTTTKQLITMAHSNNADIDRFKPKRRDRNEYRMKLAKSIREGRARLGGQSQRIHLLSLVAV